MKNLGKIILFLLLIQSMIEASVRATVDSTSVEIGEMVTYSLHLSGKDVVRPTIRSLCGVDVISTSSQTSIEMINGDVTRSNVLSYKFVPQKSCTIESIEVEIAGEMQKSNPVSIKVGQVVANKDSDFILILSSVKKEVLVGEPFEVTLLFKQKRGAEAVDSKFTPPKLKGFWIKGESKPRTFQDANYSITKIIYIMAAQRVGALNITKAQMRIASRTNTRDSWGAWIPKIKWKTYYSNELNIEVKPLPSDISLVGDFTITAIPDTQEINSNEAVNLNIEVVGIGNLEDIKSFKPYIEGVSIFDEEIVIKARKLTQKIAFVGDNDFIIPAFSLKYFDLATKEIKTISTDEIAIKVKNAKPQEELTIKREENQLETKVVTVDSKLSTMWMIIIFAVGLVSGILLMLLKSWKLKPKEKTISIKDTKTVLVKLLPYKDDAEVQNMIDTLEKSLYTSDNVVIDKKLLKEIVKKYSLI